MVQLNSFESFSFLLLNVKKRTMQSFICIRLKSKFIINGSHALTDLRCRIYRFNVGSFSLHRIEIYAHITSMPSSGSWHLIEMCESNKSISFIEGNTFTNANQHCVAVSHCMIKFINVGTDERADKFKMKHTQNSSQVFCSYWILISKPSHIGV